MSSNIPSFNDMEEILTPYHENPIEITCEYKLSPMCSKKVIDKYSNVCQIKIDGLYVCSVCSNYINTYIEEANEKNSQYLSIINTQEKAYVLGCIFARGHFIQKNTIIVSDYNNTDILNEIKRILLSEYFYTKNNLINIEKYSNKTSKLTIISDKISKHLQKYIDFENNYLKFTILDHKYDFLRGMFDIGGSIKNYMCGYPVCTLYNLSNRVQNEIKENCGIECSIEENSIKWEGINSLDFLAKLYYKSTIYFQKNYNRFLHICNPVTHSINLPHFNWSRTIPDAKAPQKERFSDSGYDLHLMELKKQVGNVYYYDTGIQVQPQAGYYFELVGRSSIAKSGWTLANNIGIIDASYRGPIIVALIKTTPDATLTLPNRLVQLIPRKLILMDSIEVESITKTERGDTGFGGEHLQK